MPVAYLTDLTDTGNLTTYNLGSPSIGAEAADRDIIVVLEYASSTGTPRTVNSATIGGVSASVLHHQGITHTQGLSVTIIGARVPTGATAAISVTLSGAGGSMDAQVYRATNLASLTPYDTADDTDTLGALTSTIDVPSGGSLIAGANFAADTTAAAWTGGNEDLDRANADGSPERVTSASATAMSVETGRTIAVSGGSGDSVMAAVTLAEATVAVMPADAGSFAVTGQDVTPRVAMPAAAAAFVVSGQAIIPRVSMPAAAGAFVFTGQVVTPAVGMPAGAASFVLNGQAVTPRVSMPAAAGAFSLTGQAVTIFATRKLIAAAGSFSLAGQAARVLWGRRLVTEATSYAVSGQDVSFIRAFPSGTGTFTLMGQAVSILATRFMTVEGASFQWTGRAVSGFTSYAPDYGVVTPGRSFTRLTAVSGDSAVPGQGGVIVSGSRTLERLSQVTLDE